MEWGGIARSNLYNKAMRQATLFSNAFGQLLSEKDLNAKEDGTLKSNIYSLFNAKNIIVDGMGTVDDVLKENRFRTGSYDGDGSNVRKISLDISPQGVLIMGDFIVMFECKIFYAEFTNINGNRITNTETYLCSDDGFYVGISQGWSENTNEKGNKYYYFAFY